MTTRTCAYFNSGELGLVSGGYIFEQSGRAPTRPKPRITIRNYFELPIPLGKRICTQYNVWAFIGPCFTLSAVAKRTPSPETADVTRRLGLVIQRERLMRDMTQEEFAESTGISTNYIQNLENNRGSNRDGHTANPTVDVIFALERSFGMEVGELLVRTRDMK